LHCLIEVDLPEEVDAPMETDEMPSTKMSLLEKAAKALEEVGKELSVNEQKCLMSSSEVTLQTTGNPSIFNTGTKPRCWNLNYPALAFMLNGGYYSDYDNVFGTMGLPVMHHTTWEGVVQWVGKYVERLAQWSCDQVRTKIVARGDKEQWQASYDGFYLTRGHHSNNASATLHDVQTDSIAWFAHRTKKGKGANWGGTSSGAEGDMLLRILEDVKSNGFIVDQIVMDHDTSANAIVCSQFPDTHITYCGNHTAKTFHSDLSKIRSLKCKCKQNGLQCKRMSKIFVDRAKHSLKCLMSCSEVLDSDNPLTAFSEGIMNFYNHYCKDEHASEWCKYHVEKYDDGTPYSTKHRLVCAEQAQAFHELLQNMSERPQEYVTSKGKLTTNSIEGFHGLALKYRNKRTDLNTIHYCCKTNMAICHKNLGPIWKLICMCEMGIDVPQNAITYMLSEQNAWSSQRKRRNSDVHHHYRSLTKRKAVKRHEDEKSYMTTLKAAGYSTGEYVGTGLGDDEEEEQAEEEQGSDEEEQADEGELTTDGIAYGEQELVPNDDSFLPSDEGLPYDDMHPLLLFYDCEATGGSIYDDNIIEIAAKVIGVPNTVNIACREFSSFSNTSRRIIKAVQDKCGITAQMLYGQPSFPAVLEMFLRWINDVVEEVNTHYNLVHYPVLVAHNGFTFDFPILLAELHRRRILFNRLRSINLHFADTYFECKRLVKDNFEQFVNWTPSEKRCLGIPKLYAKLFPDSAYNAHRALEDVGAMEQIFTSSSLARVLSELTIRGVEKLAQTWTLQVQTFKRVSKLLLKFGQAATKCMAKRLDEHGLSYEHMLEQYKLARSNDEYKQWLQSVGIKRKAWHGKIVEHFKKVQ